MESKKRILNVDDNNENRDVLSEFFLIQGFEVETANHRLQNALHSLAPNLAVVQEGYRVGIAVASCVAFALPCEGFTQPGRHHINPLTIRPGTLL